MTTISQLVEEYYGQLKHAVPMTQWREARSVMERFAARLRSESFDPVRDIEFFHARFQLYYPGTARPLPADLQRFRVLFMAEELSEYVTDNDTLKKLIQSGLTEQLPSQQPLEKQFDALIDLVYVALGTAHLHGFDFREGWRRVHEANMEKVRGKRAEESKRARTFDVIKPPGWRAPDLSDLVPLSGPPPSAA